MNRQSITDLGHFEGFNFRTQSAIERILTADDVKRWDHDKKGEAEFWPTGSNCNARELIEIERIVEELEGDETELLKAIYLRQTHGMELEKINQARIEERNIFIFGPETLLTELWNNAAWELLELYYPEAYKLVESAHVPGVIFDETQFIEQFITMQIRRNDSELYLVVEPY